MNPASVNKYIASEIYKIAETKEDYRKLATERAADIIAALETSVVDMDDKDILEIKFIGPSTLTKIREISSTPDFEKNVESFTDTSIQTRYTREELNPIVDRVCDMMDFSRGKYLICGSWRRELPTVKDLDIVITDSEFMDIILRLDFVEKKLWGGDQKLAIIEKTSGVQIDFRLSKDESFGACTLYFTGPKEFNIKMRGLAKSMGLLLNEYGLFQGGERIAGETEEGIFEALDMDYVAPWDRR